LAPEGAVALLGYAVGSWVAKGANIIAVVVVGGVYRTAWAWAGLATDRPWLRGSFSASVITTSSMGA
jgi:hypothetical protein